MFTSIDFSSPGEGFSGLLHFMIEMENEMKDNFNCMQYFIQA